MAYRTAILDDEELMREGIQLKYPFVENGFTIVYSGGDGGELLNRLHAVDEEVDLIFVDIMMPVMGGLDFIIALKEKFPDTIVVIVTGHDDFEFARQALRLGVRDYLLKPLDAAELELVMERVKEKLEQKWGSCKADDDSPPANGKEIMKKVLRDMEKDYASKITLKDYADRYYIHPNYLVRLFRQCTGSTFNEILTRTRMEKAKNLLLTSSRNASDIARDVGYEDPRYFRELFRRHHMHTPSEYRKRFQRG